MTPLPTASAPQRPAQRSAWTAARLLTAGVLLFAAVLKGHQLATQPTPNESLFTNRWALILLVEGQWLLALFLLSNALPRLAWAGAVGCFALFSAVTLYKGLSGEATCGCFGGLDVSPWYTLALDVGLLVMLLFFYPPLRGSPRPRGFHWRLVGTAVVALAAGLPAGILMAAYEPARLAPGGEIVGDDRFVLLEPETWIGSRCPMLAHMDIGDRLGRGRWVVVLYHYDCPRCRERLPGFEREAGERARRLGAPRTAMVELPPYAPPTQSLLSADSPCARGRVDQSHDWFALTPTVFALDEGVVVDVQADAPQRREQAVVQRPAAAAPATEEARPVPAEGYDFGFVEPGSEHAALLAVPNPFGTTIRITRVLAECTCTAGEISKDPVGPGQSILVRVEFEAPKEPTRYAKRIVLFTDDHEHPKVLVRIKADVGLPLKAEPSPLDLGRFRPGETRHAEVAVTNRGKQPVRLLYSTSSVPGCVAEVPLEAIPPGGRVMIPLRITAGEPGTKRGIIHLTTDVKSQPELGILATLVVEPAAEAAH